jgi:hypothetical protein
MGVGAMKAIPRHVCQGRTHAKKDHGKLEGIQNGRNESEYAPQDRNDKVIQGHDWNSFLLLFEVLLISFK